MRQADNGFSCFVNPLLVGTKTVPAVRFDDIRPAIFDFYYIISFRCIHLIGGIFVQRQFLHHLSVHGDDRFAAVFGAAQKHQIDNPR